MLSLALGFAQNRLGDTGFTPASFFYGGAQGVWFDPSDLTTMFQDSAGTTPVTAVGQPVGLILDKKYNTNWLITGLDTFTVTPAGTTPPTANGTDTFLGVPCISVTIPVNTGGYAVCRADGGGASQFNIGVGNYYKQTYQIALSRALTGAEGVAVYTTGMTGSAQYITLTSTSPSSAWISASTNFTAVATGNDAPTVFAQTAINSPVTVYVRQYSVVEYAGNHASQATSANRPVLQQDANNCYYLAFNGTNSSLSTAAINFTATDKMTVWAGVRKLSDATTGILTELSVDTSVNNGSFAAIAPDGANKFSFRSRGTIAATATTASAAYNAPYTAVISGIGDISGANVAFNINGALANQVTTSQGTGTFGTYPLYIGARAGTSLFFNGNLYGLIVLGAASTAQEIASTEAYMNGKTRAY